MYPEGSPQAASTSDLLNHVRNQVIPAATKGTGLTVLVGGTAAIFEDFGHILSAKLPLFIGVVVALSFILLIAVFRSLVIPVHRGGHEHALGRRRLRDRHRGLSEGLGRRHHFRPIETFVPVLMFPILFGLSMDYEVFLISRIYEE